MNLDIDPLSFPSIAYPTKTGLPLKCGVYFAFSDKKELLYIGQSTNLKQRWHNHHLRDKGITSISWMEVETEQLNELEALLIEKFKPPLNEIKPLLQIPSIDKDYYLTAELLTRYNLKERQSLYVRMRFLGIKAKKQSDKGRAIIPSAEVELLDELHRHIVVRGIMRGFVPQVKVPETLAPIVGVKKNLQIIKDYHEGKIKLPLHEVLAIVNEAIIYADLIN
jgi:hypothetical protein